MTIQIRTDPFKEYKLKKERKKERKKEGKRNSR